MEKKKYIQYRGDEDNNLVQGCSYDWVSYSTLF